MIDLPLPAIWTVNIAPEFDLGPVTLAWHGVTIALGIALGTVVASWYARRRGLDPEPVVSAVMVLTLAGVVGARLVFLLEHGELQDPSRWLGTRGFSFYGGMIFGTGAVAVQLLRQRLDPRYIDALAVGFPLGMALGRVGDLINGEHYGAPSDMPWAIRYSHPDADVPSATVAYHSGGLYEIVLALAVGLGIWLLRRRLRHTGDLLFAVIGLYGLGRFAMFFYRDDSPAFTLGLNSSQWLSLLLVGAAVLGLALSRWPALRRRLRMDRALLGLSVVLVAVAVLGCGGDDKEDAGTPAAPRVEDPGPVHVHGLGINPKDGALFIATHTGLFRAPERGQPRRVAGRYQDTMGFTIVGPDRFLGSGHPDGREKLPPFLGLIRSDDAGNEWKPVSLLGKRDFHVLEAAGDRVYGFGTDFETRRAGFLVSLDGGRSWDERPVPEPLVALAIDPQDPERLVASGERSLALSSDGGRRWRAIDGPPGLLAWTAAGLTVIDQDGGVHSAGRPGVRPASVGNVGGPPAAFDSGPDGELYAALHDGAIKRSTDGGRNWTVRTKPE